jgi:hypothetical protein
MTRDLRSALAEATPVRSFPDTEQIWRRGRRIARRRRVVRGLTALVVIAGVWASWTRLDLALPPTERTADEPPVEVIPLHESHEPMAPGTYRSTRMSPAVTLTIPPVDDDEPAWVTYEDQIASIDVGWWTPPGSQFNGAEFDVSVHVFDRVLDPATGRFTAPPQDLASWLDSLPSTTVTRLHSTTIAGRRATVMEVATTWFPKSNPDGVYLVISKSGHYMIADSTTRFYFLESDGRLIAVAVQAPTRHFRSFFVQAEPILRSIRIDTTS